MYTSCFRSDLFPGKELCETVLHPGSDAIILNELFWIKIKVQT